MNAFRKKLYEIIFEADTKAGKIFDIILLISILVSVVVVILDSVKAIHANFSELFYLLEWFLTVLFSTEYILRLYTVNKPLRYIFSFYGLVDLLSVLPSYLSMIFIGSHYLSVIRVFRLLRIFRVLKLARYVSAANVLSDALKSSKAKIVVFFELVALIVIIIGSIMYLVEGSENGFDNIPKSIYWAIVTITTVGYGDIAPQTIIGQVFASLLMLTGYAIIAVPTGIVTVEARKNSKTNVKKISNTQVCQNCQYYQHDDDAKYCKLCGYKLQ